MSKADGGMMPFTSLEEVWHKRQLTGREQNHLTCPPKIGPGKMLDLD